MRIRFIIKIFLVLFLIANLSKADDKTKRVDKSTWIQANEVPQNLAPIKYTQDPIVFDVPLDPGYQTDSYILGPEVPTGNTGFYDFKTNGEANHYIQVDPSDPLLYHAVDVQSDTLDAAGTTTRRSYYTISSDGGASWSQLGQVPEIRSGFSVLKLKDGKALIANHGILPSSTLPNTSLYEDVAPQGGSFTQYEGNLPTGIWPQMAMLSNGNAIILSKPQHITGADNNDTLFYQIWNGTTLGPKSIAYIAEPPYIGQTTVGTNMTYNIASNGAGRVTMVIHSVNSDDTLGSSQILQKTSTDDGATWGPIQVIFSPYIVNGTDTITAIGGCDLTYKQNSDEWYYSFAATSNSLFSEGRIYVIKSDGTISTMVTATQVGATTDFVQAMSFVFNLDQPSLGWSSDGTILYCVYAVVKPDLGSSGFNSRDVYYQRSLDGGTTWGTPIQVTNTPTIDECYPSVSDWNQSTPTYDLNFTYMKDPGVGPASFNGNSPLAPASKNTQIFRKVSQANVIGISGNGINVKDYTLNQNYPNPFNPTTTISYNLVKSGYVTLKIYNLLGKEVKTLVNEFQQSGQKEINFNGSDLSSGVYFYRISSGGFSDLKKMMLIK